MGGGKTSAKLQLDLLKLVAHNLVELSVGICGGSSGTAIVRAMGKAKNLRYLELRCDAGSKNAVRRIEIPVGVRKLELAVADFDDLPAVWDLASRAPAVLQEWTIAVDSYKHRFYRPRVETMHLELFPAKIVGLLSSVQGWPSVLEALAVLPGLKLRNLVVTKARCFNNGLADTNFGAWWKIYEAMPSLRTVSFENIRTDCHVLHGLPGAVEELHLINPGWTLSQEAAREQLRTALRRMDKLWLIEIKIEGDYWGARDWNNERPFWDALAEEAWARASISL
ncbi:hypothetical protein DFJ74DRAFT_688417 [Hyaloraphidium curvatum]|nr:hypothetical protein DFJ74DRAFT_688417 [Hyaloraphidium curvatum]